MNPKPSESPASLPSAPCPLCGHPTHDRDRFLSPEQVLELTGIKSKWTLKSMRERGDFPEPLALGPRLRVYREKEVLEWLNTRPRVKVALRVRKGKAVCEARPAV